MLAVGADDPETRAVMARALRGAPGFDHEYPTVFGPRARGSVVRWTEEGRVRSACAILARDLRCPEGVVRVGLIGSVATAEEARGRGLATRVLERAEQELAAQDCVATLLWADDEAFYAKRGYARVGGEEDFVLERALRPHLPAPVRVRIARPADAPALHALYRAHPRRAVRTRRESAALYAGPGMRVFVHDGPRGIDAYACLGRGGDLAAVVHEWAGATDGLLACLAAAFEARSDADPLFLMAPLGGPDEEPNGLTARLRDAGVPSAPGVLALGRVVRPDRAQELLCRACTTPDALRSAATEVAGPAGVAALDDAHLLACLLAPRGERAAVADLEATTGLAFPGLPLRPFLWGLDSI